MFRVGPRPRATVAGCSEIRHLWLFKWGGQNKCEQWTNGKEGVRGENGTPLDARLWLFIKNFGINTLK